MPEVQIKYVAVRPDGSICGPIGDTEEFVQHALLIGYLKTGIRITRNVSWKEVERLGYTVRKAEIKILEKETK